MNSKYNPNLRPMGKAQEPKQPVKVEAIASKPTEMESLLSDLEYLALQIEAVRYKNYANVIKLGGEFPMSNPEIPKLHMSESVDGILLAIRTQLRDIQEHTEAIKCINYRMDTLI
jgi:hypothetical protein